MGGAKLVMFTILKKHSIEPFKRIASANINRGIGLNAFFFVTLNIYLGCGDAARRCRATLARTQFFSSFNICAYAQHRSGRRQRRMEVLWQTAKMLLFGFGHW